MQPREQGDKAQISSSLERTEHNTRELSVSSEAMAHIMSVLTRLYENPIEATVRELLSNARDAHIAADKADVPVNITLPTSLSPSLIIEDEGVGMSRTFLIESYTQYGTSSKRDSDNTETGMLGLGAKAPLAYADSMTIDTIHDGWHTVAVLSRNERGVGQLEIMVDEPAADITQTGTTITVPVEHGDVGAFQAAANHVTWPYKDNEITITNDSRPSMHRAPHYSENYSRMYEGQLPAEHGGYKLRVYTHESDKLPHRNNAFYMNNSHVVMAGVAYPLGQVSYHLRALFGKHDSYTRYHGDDTPLSSEADTLPNDAPLRKLTFTANYYMTVEVEGHAVDFTPSRDSLEWTKQTKRTIIGAFNTLAEGVDSITVDEVSDEDYARMPLADRLKRIVTEVAGVHGTRMQYLDEKIRQPGGSTYYYTPAYDAKRMAGDWGRRFNPDIKEHPLIVETQRMLELTDEQVAECHYNPQTMCSYDDRTMGIRAFTDYGNSVNKYQFLPYKKDTEEHSILELAAGFEGCLHKKDRPNFHENDIPRIVWIAGCTVKNLNSVHEEKVTKFVSMHYPIQKSENGRPKGKKVDRVVMIIISDEHPHQKLPELTPWLRPEDVYDWSELPVLRTSTDHLAGSTRKGSATPSTPKMDERVYPALTLDTYDNGTSPDGVIRNKPRLNWEHVPDGKTISEYVDAGTLMLYVSGASDRDRARRDHGTWRPPEWRAGTTTLYDIKAGYIALSFAKENGQDAVLLDIPSNSHAKFQRKYGDGAMDMHDYITKECLEVAETLKDNRLLAIQFLDALHVVGGLWSLMQGPQHGKGDELDGVILTWREFHNRLEYIGGFDSHMLHDLLRDEDLPLALGVDDQGNFPHMPDLTAKQLLMLRYPRLILNGSTIDKVADMHEGFTEESLAKEISQAMTKAQAAIARHFPELVYLDERGVARVSTAEDALGRFVSKRWESIQVASDEGDNNE